MKKIVSFLLAAVLMMGMLPLQNACAKDVLYRGIITHRYKDSFTKVYAKMDKESKAVKYLDPGNKINITAMYPEWVEVVLNDGRTGYIIRQRIDVTEAVDTKNTPPYPVWVQPYYLEIDRTVEVKAE